MSFFRLVRGIFRSKVEPQTVSLGELGEFTNDQTGCWIASQPVGLGGRKVELWFMTGERPPGDHEIALFDQLATSWHTAWAAILAHLQSELEVDDLEGERDRFLRKLRPECVIFFAGLDHWEVVLSPSIYDGHIVTMRMNGLNCEDFKLDG